MRLFLTNAPGLSLTVLGATIPTLPLGDWTVLGTMTESAPGQYQFTDPYSLQYPQRYYRTRFP